ncbi:MAG: alanine racemase [Bryobacterales bacterium]|nr:alanine racemase [Bryobacteraceae bacterium]MDW8353147.1 alanine racemase [Bryobacterales bacterium]
MTSPLPAGRRCWVEVSLGQIVANFRAVQAVVGDPVEVMPVVKADAYGHGAVPVSQALEAAGARWLAVSHAGEGAALRQAGIRARILVMADLLPWERDTVLAHELTPVVHALEQLPTLEAMAAAAGRKLAFHLKVDSGMGRLGVAPDAATIVAAIRQAPHLEMEGVMTHLASSADYTRDQTERQLAVFERFLDGLAGAGIRPRWVHVASSNPIAFGRRAAWRNMVRPGHALYGYVSPPRGPAPARVLEVRPALTWKTVILAVKDVAAGAEIGYGAMYRAPRPMRIAVLAAGYADGYPHRLSNRGKVIAGGRLAPVIGAVSMDLTTIDISQTPHLRPGDPVTLLGRAGEVVVDAQQIARWAGTISYSVLCGISARVPRLYL